MKVIFWILLIGWLFRAVTKPKVIIERHYYHGEKPTFWTNLLGSRKKKKPDNPDYTEYEEVK